MARVKSTLQITGSINGLSFYTIRGGDTVYVRTKGGPSARRMKVGEEFATVRKHQAEWEACVKFSKMLKGTVGAVAKLGDFNVSPVWNGLGKKIMALVCSGQCRFDRATALCQYQFGIGELFGFSRSGIVSGDGVFLAIDGCNRSVDMYLHIVLLIETFRTLQYQFRTAFDVAADVIG